MASKQDSFQLKFQPIVGLADAEWEFYEVKLQLQLPNKEVVDSSVFLHAADRLGLSEDIGNWLVRNAFEKLENNASESRNIKLVINLSGQYFQTSTLVDSIASAVEAYHIDAADIVFQVSEQAAIKEIERTRQHMNTLTGIGFRFSLSEFGSDNQSFNYLKGLPVD